MMVLLQTLIECCSLGLLLILPVAFCGEVVAQETPALPRIEISADRDSVQILDPFEVTLIVTAGEKANVQLPIVVERFGPFEVLDHRDILGVPVDGEPGIRRWVRSLTLETMKTGSLDVPAIEVFVRESESAALGTSKAKPIRLVTKPLSIKVATVLEAASDPAKFNDIRGVIDVAEPQESDDSSLYWIGLVAAGGLGLSAFAAMAFVLVRRQRWTTPAEWAQGEIANLADSSNAMEELDRILRRFIESEFEFPATTLSWEPLRLNLVKSGASDDLSLIHI